jgi:plasmid stability protein
MKLTLTFSPEIEARLRARAAASGQDVESVVRDVVEQSLGTSAGNGRRAEVNAGEPTVRDLVAVLRSFPPTDDGWATAVDEAIRRGNEPLPPGSTWRS